MPLYKVQDSDRPMFVVGESFERALEMWKVQVASENPDCDVSPPDGITLVADDLEILIAHGTPTGRCVDDSLATPADGGLRPRPGAA